MNVSESIENHGQTEQVLPSEDLFRIGEVSRLTDTKQFVLRYWESEFPMLQPVKSPKGHRLYRRQDIDTVLVIKRLLYDEGFTIAGARRHLREQGVGAAASERSASNSAESAAETVSEGAPLTRSNGVRAEAPVSLNRQTLLDLRDSLRSFLTLLERE